MIYPPICQEGWSNGVHQPNAGGDDDTCVGDAADPAHGDHGLHDCKHTRKSSFIF